MFCSKCGTENTDHASFCLKCGAGLTPTEPLIVAEKNEQGQLDVKMAVQVNAPNEDNAKVIVGGRG